MTFKDCPLFCILLFTVHIYILRFCAGTPNSEGIPVKYSSPICASSGGSTTLTCDGSYAVHSIFIGRDREGACGWTESSELDCSIDYTYSEQVRDMMNIVYTRVEKCFSGTCEITGIPSISTSCASDAVIRVAYFCYTNSLIRENGGAITQTSGCSLIRGDNGNVFECPERNHRVNILYMDFSYLEKPTPTSDPKETCDDGAEMCRLDYQGDSYWINIHEKCLEGQNCAVSALGDDAGLVYGCTDLQTSGIEVVSYFYKFICQNPAHFTVSPYILPQEETCIGMSNGLHAVIFGGRFDNNNCFRSYTVCLNGNIQEIQTCPMGQGFHQNTRQCQNIAGQFCSVGTPELSTQSVSATEIRAFWTIDDNPDSYNLTIRSVNSGSFAQVFDSLTDTENTFDELTPNTNYSISIAAVKQNFESQISTGWNVTYPENPTGTVTDVASDRVTINWEYQFTASSLLFSVEPSETSGSIKIPVSNNQGSRTVDNLEGGTEYRVTLILEGMTGLQSLEPYLITFRSLPLPPENLTSSEITESSIKFQWDQDGSTDGWRYSLTPDSGGTEVIVNGVSERNFDGLEGGTLYMFTVSNYVNDPKSGGTLDSLSINIQESTIPRPAFYRSVSPQYNSVNVEWGHDDGRAESFFLDVKTFSDSQQVSNETTTEKKDEFLNLDCGTNYSVNIRALSHGKSSSEVTQDFTTYPEAPQTLIVQSFDTVSVSLNWRSVDNCNVDSYQLQWLDAGTPKEETIASSQTSATVLDLHPGRTYRFEVRAAVIDYEGSTLLSTSNPRETSVTQTLVPLPPLNVDVDDFSSDSIQLSWVAPTDSDFTGFEVTYDDKTVSVESGTTSVLENLTPGTLQEVRLRTFSQGTDSTQYSEIVLKIQRLNPNPPTNFKEQSKSSNSTVISFDQPSGEYSGFEFEATSSTGTVLSTKVISSSSETVYFETIDSSDVHFGDQISFSIFAVSDTQLSEVPETGTVNLYPANPVEFHITGFSTKTLDVSWGEPPGFYAGHELLLRRLDSEQKVIIEFFSSSESSKNYDSLVPGAQYEIEISTVSKFDSSLFSENSLKIFQTLKPNPPIDLAFDAIDKTSLNLTWRENGKFHTFELSFEANSEITRQFYEEIRNLSPATTYNFSIITVMSDVSIKSEPSTIEGYTYPDDVTGLNCEATSSSDGAITVAVGWSLAVVSYEHFKFVFTSIPYRNEETNQKTVILTQDEKGTSSPFDHVFNASDIEWLVPGLKLECRAVAVYLNLESQTIASQQFYAPPLAPVLSFVEDSRTTTSLTFSWSFVVENSISESYEIEFSIEPIPSQSAAESTQTENSSEQISDLVPGQLYTFRIRSCVDNGTLFSDWSESVIQATYPEVPLSPSINYPELSWSTPQSGLVEAYQVRVSDGFDNSDIINITNPSERNALFSEFNNVTFVAGRRYTFNIFSISNNLYSTTSSSIEFVLPPNDVIFEDIEEASTSSVSLHWQVPVGDVEKYVITVIPLTAEDRFEQFTEEVPGKSSDTTEITGLTPGAMYRFEIVASSNNVVSETPGVITFEMQPLLSTIQLSSLSETSASCSWGFEGVVDNFTVSVRDSDSNTVPGSVSVIVDRTMLSHTFEGLTAGETYSCVTVAAAGSKQSEPIAATFTTYPFTPEVDVAYFGTSNFSANWSVQSEGSKFDSFRVALRGCTVEQFNETFASADARFFVWNDLTPGSQCQVDVWTISSDQYSRSKASASQNLYPATPEPTQTGTTINSVSISWELEGLATEFRLEIEDLRNETFTGAQREVTLSDLEPFNIYSVTLDAYNGNELKNLLSAKLTVRTAAAPVTSAAVESISDTELFVTWDSVSSASNQQVTYLITRIPLENVTEDTTVTNVEVSDTEYMDKSLIPGTDYTYEIKSRYSGGESEGFQTSGYTYPAAPSRILTENTHNDLTGLRWITTPNYDSFIVNVQSLNDSFERTISTSDDRVYLENLDPGQKYIAQIQSKYRALFSKTSARLVFQTAFYPVGVDRSKPWIVAFWITFIYAIIITTICLFLSYLVYNGSFQVAQTIRKKKEPIKQQGGYLTSASPLDGTKWQKAYPPLFLDNPIYSS